VFSSDQSEKNILVAFQFFAFLHPGSFTTEVAQLKRPHLPAADIEGSARYNRPRRSIVGSEGGDQTGELKWRGGFGRPFFLAVVFYRQCQFVCSSAA
jgi:hypothetical protein